MREIGRHHYHKVYEGEQDGRSQRFRKDDYAKNEKRDFGQGGRGNRCG